MKHKLQFTLLLLLSISLLGGCGKEDAQKETISIGALKGPTAIGMVQLMEEAEQGNTTNDYQFTIAGTADELTTGISNGEIQIAAIPCNLASILYNKTNGGITLAGINTLGVLYIVETGTTIQSVNDLKNKTIYSTGKGTTPEYTLRQLLLSAGIDPDKDVTIEYKSEATEVATLLSSSEDAIAMLPQPYVTTVMMNNDKVRIALDVTKEWEALDENSTVVTGVVVVNTTFLKENKDAVDAFLEEYRTSTNFAVNQVEECANLVEKFGIFKATVAQKAIPYCNIVLLTGKEMQQKAESYLSVLYEQNPQTIGGALPAEDFYYLTK